MLVGLDKKGVMTMSNKKYTYDELVNMVTDTMYDWFDNLDDEDTAHPVLGMMIMSEAMSNLKMAGYCQHDTVDMVSNAIDLHIDVEKSYAQEHGTEPFPNECEHDRASFLEAMKPISKKLN